jgi:pyruvate formate lyase activating enzyme
MESEIFGNIHSIETCGTVDGPGVRFVVFLQGCPMRCKYCHNPDTWDVRVNKKISVNDILEQYDGVKEFCKGGITVTGGEPLLQPEFVALLFKAAKEKNIHTALDTSGVTFNSDNTEKIDKVLKYTDLVMLDIKHIDDSEHKKLTGHTNKNILEFARYLSENNIPMWVRHVVVPGITFDEYYLSELGKFLKTLKNVEALDVLPYHDMAKGKYKGLGLDYPLGDTPPLTKDQAIQARDIILKNMKQ